MQELFAELDADGSGYLDAEELGVLFKNMRMPMGQRELYDIVDEIDVDGNGELDRFELTPVRDRDCEAEGEGVGYAGTHAPAIFLIRAKEWVGRECTSGGEMFEAKLRGPVSLQAGAGAGSVYHEGHLFKKGEGGAFSTSEPKRRLPGGRYLFTGLEITCEGGLQE